MKPSRNLLVAALLLIAAVGLAAYFGPTVAGPVLQAGVQALQEPAEEPLPAEPAVPALPEPLPSAETLPALPEVLPAPPPAPAPAEAPPAEPAAPTPAASRPFEQGPTP